jgi:hypothetical protein
MTNFEQFGENIRDRPKIGVSLGMIDYDFPAIDIVFMNNHFPKSNARALIEKARPKVEAKPEPAEIPVNPAPVPKNIFQRIKELIS